MTAQEIGTNPAQPLVSQTNSACANFRRANGATRADRGHHAHQAKGGDASPWGAGATSAQVSVAASGNPLESMTDLPAADSFAVIFRCPTIVTGG